MRLGFLINPIAGMGGATGLKGTDGAALQHAIAKGATPIAPKKAKQALSELLTLKDQLEVVAADGVMGATPARALGFSTTVVGLRDTGETTARHSRAAMQAMCDAEVNLILFVGGDGTARDLLAASEGADIAVIGAPSGVKMHSGVFATSPRVAGSLARRFLTATNRDAMLRVVEIVDRQIIDGVDYSEPHCFGVMRSPYAPMATLHPKASSNVTAQAAIDGACWEITAKNLADETLIIGPGATMQAIKRHLGDEGTLLGVDVFRAGQLVARDADRDTLAALVSSGTTSIMISPTGGQGFLFGRGNQQIDASVIKAVGVGNILIVSSMEKLMTLKDGALFVDTGDAALNVELSGYAPIITGTKRRTMFRIVNPDDQLIDNQKTPPA